MKLEIDISREDYYYYNLQHFLRTRLTTTIISALLIVVIATILINIRESSVNYSALITSFLIVLVIYAIYVYYSLTKTRLIPFDDGNILGKKEYTFTDSHLSYKDKNSEGKTNWIAIKEVIQDKNAVYLYVDSISAFMIPKRYLTQLPPDFDLPNWIIQKVNEAKNLPGGS